MSSVPVYALERLTVGYGDRPVVHRVSLRVDPGEVVAVLGSNGSGKTTLVRGLLGLARIHAGSLRIFGVRHDRFGERWRIGYVPQRHTIGGAIPCSVREVVDSGRLPRHPTFGRPLFGRRRADDVAAVDDALAQVGLADRARDPVSTLSGGQQRRVLVARALASRPDVLVMDEPTAGVDTAAQRSLARTLAALTGGGTTMLLVTHELAPFASLVSRALLIRDGRVAFDGHPDRLRAGAVPQDDAHHELAAEPLSRSGLGMTG